MANRIEPGDIIVATLPDRKVRGTVLACYTSTSGRKIKFESGSLVATISEKDCERIR